MKTIKKILLMLFAAALSVAFLVGCGGEGGGGSSYFLKADLSKVSVDGTKIHVEYGESFLVPSAAVTDASGTEYDVDVKWTMTDASGTDMTQSVKLYFFEAGTYTLTYKAITEQAKISDLSYTIECSDTLVPEVNVVGLRESYSVGDTCEIGIQSVNDASGIDESKTYVKAWYGNEELTINNLSFPLNRSGDYKLVISYTDNAGNENKLEYTITAVGDYEEPNVKGTLWGFEEVASLANLRKTAASGEFERSVTAEKTNGSGKSLKLTLAADTKAEFFLIGANPVAVKDVGKVVFNIYSTNLIDWFRVYTPVELKEINFDYRVLKNEWYEISFDPWDYFDENYVLEQFKIVIWVEEEATIYIDGVYATDYVEPWHDENLGEDLYADFDEIEYKQRLGAITGKDSSTFGGAYEIAVAGREDLPEDTHGGAIKFTTVTDPATVSDKQSRDGFYYKFVEKFTPADYSGINLRIDFLGYGFTILSVSFVTDMSSGDIFHTWVHLTPKTGGGYQTVTIPLSQKDFFDEATTKIIGIYMRFHRRVNEEYTLFIDEMGPANLKNFDDSVNEVISSGKYEKTTGLEVVGNAVYTGYVKDSLSENGKAVFATTSYAQTPGSGLKFILDPTDVSKYDKILIGVRANDSFNIYINDEYKAFVKFSENYYTQLNIKQYFTSGTLTSIAVTRTTVAGRILYIDNITFVENAPDTFNMAFTAIGNEVKVEPSGNTTTLKGLVGDATSASGKSVLVERKSGDVSNLKLTLTTPLTVNAYESIKILVKNVSPNNMFVYGNSIDSSNADYAYVGHVPTDGAWYEFDLVPSLKERGVSTLTAIYIRNGYSDEASIYIGGITFADANFNAKYDFGSGDALPAGISWNNVNGVGTSEIVADAKASDGYALKVNHNRAGENWYLDIDDIIVEDYSSMILRLRVDYDKLYLYVYDESGGSAGLSNYGLTATDDYVEIDLIAIAKEKGFTKITKIGTWISGGTGNLYIDSITVTEK